MSPEDILPLHSIFVTKRFCEYDSPISTIIFCNVLQDFDPPPTGPVVKANLAYSAIPFSLSGNRLESIYLYVPYNSQDQM